MLERRRRVRMSEIWRGEFSANASRYAVTGSPLRATSSVTFSSHLIHCAHIVSPTPPRDAIHPRHHHAYGYKGVEVILVLCSGPRESNIRTVSRSVRDSVARGTPMWFRLAS